jgi:predicted protein tyrosine phosphatase
MIKVFSQAEVCGSPANFYPVVPTIAIRCLMSKFCEKRHDRKNEDCLFLEDQYVDVLNVVFDDIIEKECGEDVSWFSRAKASDLQRRLEAGKVEDDFFSFERKPDDGSDYIYFNGAQALDIKRFVAKNMGKFKDVMIHCFAGVSRSWATCAAIGDHYKQEAFKYDEYECWFRENGFPNPLVYERLTRVLLDKSQT